jgi:hypothetical protein
VQSKQGVASFGALANGISGPVGAPIQVRASGLNPIALNSNVGIWSSSISTLTFEIPGLVLPDPADSSKQIFLTAIPPLPAGAATLVLRNKSTGSTTEALTVSITAPTPLSEPPEQIIDEFLAATITYFQNVPTSTPEESAALNRVNQIFAQTRVNLSNLVASGLTPELTQGLEILARIIARSDIYQVGSRLSTAPFSISGYDADAKIGDVLGLLGSMVGGATD